jgi:hypothetical protein
MLNDQNMLTPAAMAGELNEGGPVRGPKDQPGNGPRPKPQLSLMESVKPVNSRERSPAPCSTCLLSLFPEHTMRPLSLGALHSTEPRISAFCRLATLQGAARAHG